MRPSDCSKDYVKSATAKRDGNNYIITIVMKDQVNPSYDDLDGLARMSRGFIDYKDVVDAVETDGYAVSKIVKSTDSTITYKDYTIVATMNAKGQFVSIEHYYRADFEGDITLTEHGTTAFSGACNFRASYYDFKY